MKRDEILYLTYDIHDKILVVNVFCSFDRPAPRNVGTADLSASRAPDSPARNALRKILGRLERRYQSHIVPSSSRATGSCFGEYG